MIWHTWLSFAGLIGGLAVSGVFGWPPLRTAGVGFVGGLVAVTVINLVSPSAPCLQDSQGLNILRAYSLECVAAR